MVFSITIENLTFYAIMGILPHERQTPQKIVINIQIAYHYQNNSFIDYAKVINILQNHIKKNRFTLLEDALHSSAILLKNEFQQIKSLKISIKKPDILPNAIPSVSLSLNFD